MQKYVPGYFAGMIGAHPEGPDVSGMRIILTAARGTGPGRGRRPGESVRWRHARTGLKSAPGGQAHVVARRRWRRR